VRGNRTGGSFRDDYDVEIPIAPRTFTAAPIGLSTRC
jgi:hypothetical protein